MSPESAARVAELLAAALTCPPEGRAAFLAHACGDDATLRAEIESLLRLEVTDFLADPVRDLATDLLADSVQGELKPGDTLGDCRVISLLGIGGMGEVYLAEDTALGRLVAVKVIGQGRGGSLLERFRHEQRVLAGLNHPNIARLYGGAVAANGRAYLVMEYVEGERLDEYCNTRGLSLAERLALFRQVCGAVMHAHRNLVVHRDLKPANIRVTPAGEPKLLDFGVAKLLDPDPTRNEDLTVTMYGAMTPGYASPEQLRGDPITTSTDVYSLGVILYELLTGQRPFGHDYRRADELARAIGNQEPVRPSTVVSRRTGETGALVCGEPPARLRRHLEGDLDNIVVMALRRDPARRYASVAQFAEDIRRHGEGLPVLARQDTLGYRAGKFVQRNRTTVAAAALVLLALIGGLVATSWQARVAKQERDRARLAQAQAEQAQRRAETARQQADRVNAFLQKLLGSAEPGKLGKDVKVADVLDAAGKNIDTELASEPEILAQVHSTLGTAYEGLKILAPAEQHSRAALAILRRLHGDDDPATLRQAYLLAAVLTQRLNLAASEPLLRQVIAWQRRQPSPDANILTHALGQLGFVLTQTNRPAEAEPMLTEAVALARQHFGENSPEYRDNLNTLGVLKRAEKDLDGSTAILRHVLDLYDRFAPNEPGSFVPRLNLCVMLFAQGKLDEMATVVQRMDQDRRRFYDDKSLYAGLVAALYSTLDFARGDYPKAAPEARLALTLVGAVCAPDNLTVVQLDVVLGLSLARTGHAAEGESFLRAAVANGQKADKVEFIHTCGNLETALGECLLAQQRYAEAEPLLLGGYAELKTRLGESQPMAVAAARRLGALYTAWNRPEDARRFAAAGTPPFSPPP